MEEKGWRKFKNGYFDKLVSIESRNPVPHTHLPWQANFLGYFLMSRNFIVASCFSPVQIDHWNTFSFNLCHKSSNNRSVGIWQDKVCVLAKLKPKLIVVFAVSLVRRDQECYYSPPPPLPHPPWDASPLQGYPHHFIGLPWQFILLGGERHSI